MSADSPPPRLILASASPRRRQLLTEAGYEFDVVVPAESAEAGAPGSEGPTEMVARLAYQKAADVVPRVQSGIIVGCDTVVECGGHVLGKPADAEDARRMLQALRGREHRVYSGLCVWRKPGPEPIVRVAVTILFMDPLNDTQIAQYLAGGAWQGKAGAFGYQDGLDWVHVVRGSESNVVGLPMELLTEMLAEASAGPGQARA
jgi:septum formation protein